MSSVIWLYQWVRNGSFRLLMLAGIILLAWGVFAPVGTLVWWINQGTESLGVNKNRDRHPASPPSTTLTAENRAIDCYIIFLPGVGDFSANQLTPGEEWFLEQLIQSHPNCVAVDDVFPYSVANQDLNGKRFMAPLWRAVEHAPKWLENVDALIKIRNLWRFAIAADERYSPVYSQGIADAIVDRMQAVYPIPRNLSRPLNVILIGTSGGAQVALGSVPYLNQWLDVRLTVVSLGGTFDGEKGFDAVDQVYHLRGDRDWIEDISQVMFASRWPLTVGSPINRAERQGRYTTMSPGSHAHDGEEGYLGLAKLPQSQTAYVELTLQVVNQLPIWLIPDHDSSGLW